MAEVLITGAAGHVGEATSRRLAGEHSLAYVVRQRAEGLPEGKIYEADLADPDKLEEVFAAERPEVVIHLASMVGGACEADPELAHKVNVEATRKLGEMALDHNVKLFVFASSAAVYNQAELAPTDEQNNVDPRSVYGRTKLLGEQALANLAEAKPDTRFAVLRPFNIYGPGFTGSLVHRLTHSTADSPVSVSSPESFYRDYVHVDDVVTALTNFAKLRALPGLSTFNIGSGWAVSTAQLLDELRAQGVTPHFTRVDGLPSYSWADITKARQQLDFRPRVDIDISEDR